jgi:hypothetical protein
VEDLELREGDGDRLPVARDLAQRGVEREGPICSGVPARSSPVPTRRSTARMRLRSSAGRNGLTT